MEKDEFSHGKGIYIGDEFPDYYGKEIEVFDDNTDHNNPCYAIEFICSNERLGNMDESDFKLTHPL